MDFSQSVPRGNLLRPRLIWRRWSSVVLQSVVAAALALLMLFWRRNDLFHVVAIPSWASFCILVCLFGIAWRVGRDRWGAFTGTRHFASYAPPWVAVLLGTAFILVSIGLSPGLRGAFRIEDGVAASSIRVGIACVGAVVVLTLASVITLRYAHTAPPRQAETKPAPPISIASFSFPELVEWLGSDKPVLDTSDDRFGHERIAVRIAGRLLQPRPPAQAVVGALGSGKTTLRHLVSEALSREPGGGRVELVSMELWPYETPKAAVEGVIRRLIDALGRQVNVIGLRGLPASYAEAMSAAGGFWSVLARLQGVPSNPFESLKAIDDVATTIGLRYVLWIEDLERFAGGETSSTADERLNPIRALLYGLDQFESITVVTATTTLRMRFDLEKIARYVEELPRISSRHARAILGSFRKGCRRADIIDPTASKAREHSDRFGDTDISVGRMFFGPSIVDVTDALLILCTTPRSMKQALRSCGEIWDCLAGEIDFDDVLVLCVLRETQPDAFALIQDNLHILRHDGWSGGEKKHSDELWKKAFDSLEVDERTHEAIEYLISFIFSSEHRRASPQGVMNHNHADYWERFLSVPRLPHLERDQPVLRTMLSEDDSGLLNLVEDPTRSAAVEDFRSLLDTGRLLRLLVPLADRRSHEDVANWSDKAPPGILPLWRMWNRRAEAGDLSEVVALRELKGALDIAVSTNLTLASELEHYFAASSDRLPELLGKGREDAKRYLRTQLVVTYCGKSVALAQALRGARPVILKRLCWGLDRIRANDYNGLPFDGWADFAATILHAAKIEPRTILPQIAGLITREVHDVSGLRYPVDEDLVRRLFGDLAAVLRLFENEIADDWVGIPYFASVSAAAQKQSPTSDEGSPTTAAKRV
jgi:hypothetical protein